MGKKSRGPVDRVVPKAASQAKKRGKVVSSPAARPRAIDNELFQWTFKDHDHHEDHTWHWNLEPRELTHFCEAIEGATGKTWRQVKGETAGKRGVRRTHTIPVDELSKLAQQRLVERDVMHDELMRIRHGSGLRIWGVMNGPRFHILWFDRDHKVCPSEMK